MRCELLLNKRIEYYVDSNGCWICTSQPLNSSGYPKATYKRVGMALNRVIAKLKYPDLPDYIHVLHKCNVRTCINPAHLYLGTHQNNMKDREDSGISWGSPGESNGRAILTQKQVDTIRKLYKIIPTSHKELAVLFGISKTQITRILNNKQWKEKNDAL